MSKSIIIKCRVTPEENERLKAQSKGLNFSDFIRSKVLDVPVVVSQNNSPKKKTKPKVSPLVEEAIKKGSYRRFVEPGQLLKK